MMKRLAQFLNRFRTEGVTHIGPVYGDPGDAIVMVIEDVLEILSCDRLPLHDVYLLSND